MKNFRSAYFYVGLSAACISLTPGFAMAQEGFELTSPAFKDGGYLHKKNLARSDARRECGGENVSPPLAWHRAPATTKSFALLMLDPEAQFGASLSHWVAYDIPPEVTALPEGDGGRLYLNGKNYRGFSGYWGACPPVGDAPHHYILMIMALSIGPGSLKPDLTRDAFFAETKGKAVGAAALVGLYAR